MSLKYDDYLREHIQSVGDAFRWLEANVPDVLGQLDMPLGYGYVLGCEHDASKYHPDEYSAYDNYFYGNKSYAVVKAFDYAWLHHIHHNPHHWQYWVLMEDEGETKPLEIPERYVIEMICDWLSFGIQEGNPRELFTWYEKHKDKMVLHEKTRKRVNDILETIRKKLDENDEFQNYDGEDEESESSSQ